MNADAFRYLYNYHFAENRKIWDRHIAALSYEQFIQNVGYSYGSVRSQILHMIDADEMWFSELENAEPPKPFPASTSDDRELIRAHWDEVEQNMRAYLANLRDDMLFEKPITNNDEDKDLILWQVLLHVVNHCTDHRAQLLRFLNDLGCDTGYQDFIFYVYEHQ